MNYQNNIVFIPMVNGSELICSISYYQYLINNKFDSFDLYL
mgnify:CR=1 FL=1